MPPDPSAPVSREGVLYALLAYFVWGFAAIYWKWTAEFPPAELLAYRVIASASVGALLVASTRSWRAVRAASSTKRSAASITIAALLLGINWLVFIYAVQTDRILATSLGYYINPLVSVVLGLVFLRERLHPMQWIAVVLASLGVIIQAIWLGGIPWIALVLALTFGLYGLVRKTAPAEPLAGFLLETSVLVPVSLGFLAWIGASGEAVLPDQSLKTWGIVAGSGLVTAVPLLAFASAARRLPLSLVGMFQYIAPTLSFGVAVALYDEPLGTGPLISFICVWIALAIFAHDSWKRVSEIAPSPQSAKHASPT